MIKGVRIASLLSFIAHFDLQDKMLHKIEKMLYKTKLPRLYICNEIYFLTKGIAKLLC